MEMALVRSYSMYLAERSHDQKQSVFTVISFYLSNSLEE